MKIRKSLALVSFVAALLCAPFLLDPAVLQANMASPVQPGAPMGAPFAELADLVIEEENLRFDLRPLVVADPVPVSATYQINNTGEERRLNLIFVTGASMIREVAVALNERPLEGLLIDTAAVPEAWQPPTQTPAVDDGEPLPFEMWEDQQTLHFWVDVPAGRSTIAVNYEAFAGSYADDAPTQYWQVGYVLAPAKAWGGFGTLHVEAQVPDGWHAASTPPLTRDGNRLHATFDGIPADVLTITAQMPSLSARTYQGLRWGAIVLGVVICALFGYHIGQRLAWRGRKAGLVWALGWVVALVPVALFLAVFWIDPGTGGPQASHVYSYGLGMGALFGVPMLLVLGTLACGLAGAAGHRLARMDQRR